MTPNPHPRLTAALIAAALIAAGPLSAMAQVSLGSVRTDGIQVAGNVSVRDGRAAIGSSAAVTAGTQAADIALSRGGTVKVCAGSAMHLSAANTAARQQPMLVALDRGSIEIHTAAEKTDAILTPDMRFELSGAAPLDLRIRVVPNGDTCVENAGRDAPMLHVTQTFGEGTYFVRPGQRVLFEHGSLREVVDRETSGCGCPRGEGTVLPARGKVPEAARTNPFPDAVSQGLAAPTVPQAAPGQEHTQVSSTLAYSGDSNTVTGPPGQTTTAAEAATPPKPAEAAQTGAPKSARAQSAGSNPFRAIARFFRRLFGGH